MPEDGPAPAHAPLTPGDLRLVVAEIYDDVQRRRRSGAYPPGLERELDALFAQYAPPAAVGDDMAVILDRAERASFVDVDVPTASNRPGLPYVKQGLRKVMAWYLRYLAQQVSALGGVLTRGLALLDRRLTRLEDAVPAVSPRVVDELRGVDPEVLSDAWRRFVVDRLVSARPQGRVLHAECADGALVLDLVAAGVDAYGVDARRQLLGPPTRAGVDVRPDEALDHLRRVERGALGGLVLSGLTERSTAAALIEVADLAVDALVPGGPLVVLSATPEAWAANQGPLSADLAPGRPLRAATWLHLLAARGFTEVDVVEGERLAGGLAPVPGGSVTADVLNANIVTLNQRLFPPADYAVVARRAQVLDA